MPGDVDAVASSPDGRRLGSGGEDRTARVWDLEGGEVRGLKGPLDHVWQVAFSQDGRWLAASGYDFLVRAWRIDRQGWPELASARVMAGNQARAMRLRFASQAGARGTYPLLSVSNDGKVRLWDVEAATGAVVQRHRQAVYWADTSPDGRWVVSGGIDRTVLVTDLERRTTRGWTGPEDVVHRVGFSPDGRSVWAISWDRGIRFWDLQSGAMSVLRGHEGRLRAFAISPDGTQMASSGDVGRVVLWDSRSGAHRELGRHDAYVRSVAFSGDGRLLASQGWDQAVRLWDVRAGALIELDRHPGANVHAMAFSPDDPPRGSLASGGTSSVIHVEPVAHLAALPGGTEGLEHLIKDTTTALVVGARPETPGLQPQRASRPGT